MTTAMIDGIPTYYELVGSGPPLLMCAPGGFDANVSKWRTQGIYEQVQFLDHLSRDFTCVVYDRRDTGRSGGRVERVTWADYARHAKAMLDHLGFEKAHVMGGCMGCSVAMAFAVFYPEAVARLVLFWPVGGAKYRINGHLRFAEHLAFVHRQGLSAVVELASGGKGEFGRDPRVGPWVAAIRNDEEFASAYAAQDPENYKLIVAGMARSLLDRDTSPGAEPEDLMRVRAPTLIVPGADASHATSAARYLEECIPNSVYWDTPVEQQARAGSKVLEFLQSGT